MPLLKVQAFVQTFRSTTPEEPEPLVMASTTQTLTVLGKRKTSSSTNSLVLYPESCSEPCNSPSGSEFEQEITPTRPSSSGTQRNNKCFQCTFEGCNKAYTKPTRLSEHQRSHTGERPFICQTCHKSYLRETHLQAHARSHQPEISRPLVCSEEGCAKRFWTPQHLRAHLDRHSGKKYFVCTHEDCAETFSKHNHLRSHIALAHSPPGTKSYQCNRVGCPKSFSTNQHLKAHLKVHAENRYTCIQTTCIAADSSPVFFATWTALQHHLRTAHPPTCSHPSCGNRVFSSQKGLRAHIKLHEQRDAEAEIHRVLADSDSDAPPVKRRRGGEIGRHWVCTTEGCIKDFKSKKALNTHVNVTHLGRRDFICSEASCCMSFGYKHLLQRHLSKMHPVKVSDKDDADDLSSEEGGDLYEDDNDGKIDDITGHMYRSKSRARISLLHALPCPYPDLTELSGPDDNNGKEPTLFCDYGYTRAYDLRRHLRTIHNVSTSKLQVDRWVAQQRVAQST